MNSSFDLNQYINILLLDKNSNPENALQYLLSSYPRASVEESIVSSLENEEWYKELECDCEDYTSCSCEDVRVDIIDMVSTLDIESDDFKVLLESEDSDIRIAVIKLFKDKKYISFLLSLLKDDKNDIHREVIKVLSNHPYEGVFKAIVDIAKENKYADRYLLKTCGTFLGRYIDKYPEYLHDSFVVDLLFYECDYTVHEKVINILGEQPTEESIITILSYFAEELLTSIESRPLTELIGKSRVTKAVLRVLQKYDDSFVKGICNAVNHNQDYVATITPLADKLIKRNNKFLTKVVLKGLELCE